MFKPYGIIAALVTPLDKEENLMEGALKEIIGYALEGGVHGVFLLGSTGEIYGLNGKQKLRVMEISVEHVSGRVPVYAGAGEITTKNTIKTAQIAEKVGGISAIMVLNPYFISRTQDELIGHYLEAANSVKISIILYGCDPRTHNKIMPDTVYRLSKEPNKIGLNDSSGDPVRMREYCTLTKNFEDFAVLCRIDSLIYDGLTFGTNGAVASSANIAPKISVGIYNAFKKGDEK